MKKAVFTLFLLAAQMLQAQVLYVNNTDGTYQAFDTKQVEEITFNEEEQLINILFPGNGSQYITSRFYTGRIESIAPATDKATELTYDLNPVVTFDETDKESYNEITESIPTLETDPEYEDFVENFSTTKVYTITYSETGVTVSNQNSDATVSFTIEGTHLTINSARSKVAYILRGNCSNGSLKIYSEKRFRIIAQGITLTNPNGPAINIQSGKEVYFSIGDNSVNTLCDGATYSAPAVGSDGKEEDQKGTLFSEGQLIFDGYIKNTGVLNVCSYGGHAICSDDYIRIRSGNINITAAAKDGFRTKDKFIIGRSTDKAPVIKINATSNGIECSEGELIIEAGELDITSGGEGIKVVYEDSIPDPAITPNATIRGGYICINTTGEKSSALQSTGDYTQTGGIINARVNGNASKIINCDGSVSFTGGKLTGIASGTISADETSAGGIKCENNINITGGTIAIECSGRGSKGINCNGDIVIDGGNITLLAQEENYTEIADDKKSRAITCSNITINNGAIVASAYDNAIAATDGITINGGRVNAYSSSCTALSHYAAQTGGWLLTKDIE